MRRYEKTRLWLNRMQAIELLGGVCRLCGYKAHLDALQFDHIKPIGRAHRRSKGSWLAKSWDKVANELRSCQLLCANCHAIKSREEARILSSPLVVRSAV